jgi:hypothetical protein
MLCFTSSSVVDQLLTLMRIAGRPFHTLPPHQQMPSCWTAAMVRSVCYGVTNGPHDTNWPTTAAFALLAGMSWFGA